MIRMSRRFVMNDKSFHRRLTFYYIGDEYFIKSDVGFVCLVLFTRCNQSCVVWMCHTFLDPTTNDLTVFAVVIDAMTIIVTFRLDDVMIVT